jgi:RNA polymerase sigma factor (sigma-70 family)
VSISDAEEEDLLRRIRVGEKAASRLVEHPRDPDGSLAARRADGRKARHALIQAYLPLVVDMARTTPRGHMAVEDLIQEGNFGLMKAVDKFDSTRGVRFSTCASWWIWAKMQRAVAYRGYLVRVPVYLRNRVKKMRRLESVLRKVRPGAPPTDVELSEHLGCAPESVQALRDLDLPFVSLDLDANDGDDHESITDWLPSASDADPVEATEHNEVLSAIVDAVDGLAEREKLVMRMRFGLADGSDHTLEEVATAMGVTRERVRQIQKMALEKLRRPTRSKAIAEWIAEADR